MNKVMFLVVMAVTLMMGVIWAVPMGPEFQVNTYTTSDQEHPSVAMDGSGNFVVVWASSGQDGDGWGVYAQRYNASGLAQGSEFLVNTYTADSQAYASVGMDALGNFVVVWHSFVPPWAEESDVYGQRYDASGMAQGNEFLVNTYTTSAQSDPSMAMNGSGDFVVVWDGLDGPTSVNVYGQRYDASGMAQGGEFQANTYTTGLQGLPMAGMDGSGNFVVVWISLDQDGDGYGVYGQRYDASGVAQGGEFQVNTYTTSDQREPSVSMDASGNFVVAWRSNDQDGDGRGVYGQRYDASGVAQGGEFQINTYTTGDQGEPSVGMDGAGNFVVVWHSRGQDGDLNGVYGQRYDASGTPQGGEFQVNTYTTGHQTYPSVGMNSLDNFVVTWVSSGQDGDGLGVYGQLYAAVLAVDTIATASPSLTEGGTLAFNVTFNEDVTGVDVSDFALSITGDIPDAVIVNVTGSGNAYTVFVGDVAGDGTLRLDLIDDDSIINGGGIPLGGVGAGNGDFTTGGIYQVVPQLPIATWSVALVLLILGAMGSLFYTKKQTVKK